MPGDLDNPVDAAAWTYGLPGELYATLARRTSGPRPPPPFPAVHPFSYIMVMPLMRTTLTLADLTARTGLDVLGHLEREVTIPVIDGIQAQGDLLVIPIALLTEPQGRRWRDVYITDSPRWHEVPGPGIEVLRAGAGGNPHTLVADPGTCRWTTGVFDSQRLALGALTATGVAYLIHPEHGGSGIAPGRYIIRRQRERRGATRRPAIPAYRKPGPVRRRLATSLAPGGGRSPLSPGP